MTDPEHVDPRAQTVPAEGAWVPPVSPAHRGRRLAVILPLALVGAVVGLLVVFALRDAGMLSWRRADVEPAPHQIPKYPGGVSLRFAMVHDVLHERYLRHGKAYYEERNRLVRQQLAALGDAPTRAEWFPLMDDLGVGLDRVGNPGQAVPLLRRKLNQQELCRLAGRDLYTTYANLGTALIHDSFHKARDGDAKAKAALREGLAYIHKSIEVNPEAHFGREIWQAVTVEYLLACLDNPKLLLRFDLVGNRLDRNFDPRKMSAHSNSKPGKPSLQDRGFITLVGAEEGWTDSVPTSHSRPVPFDEPVLGIIGMWRLGGGANPHFSLALAEIMRRVGQRYIAWCGYERTARLAELYWPDADVQVKLKKHCRKRQAGIEERLPLNERGRLRPRFEAELASGERYQRAYQDYEAHRIAAGASLDNPHFYDDFHKGREPIASPVGVADQVLFETEVGATPAVLLPSVLLFAGLFAFAGALLQRRLCR